MNQDQLPPGIGAVFPFADKKARNAVIEIIRSTTGIRPVMKRNNEGVERAGYAQATTRTLLNCSSASILSRLGNPQAAMTLQVEDTHKAAETAQAVFKKHGYDAEIVDSAKAEIGMPEHFMYFVLADGFVPILFWPITPAPAMLAQMSQPEPWTDADEN